MKTRRHFFTIGAIALLATAALSTPAAAGTGTASGGSCEAGFANSAGTDRAATSHNGGCGYASIRNTYVVPGQGTTVNSPEYWASSTSSGSFTTPKTQELTSSRHSVVIMGVRYYYYVYV